MLAVSFRFPLVVLHNIAIDRMVVLVVRIVVRMSMNSAAGNQYRGRHYGSEQAGVDFPQKHRFSFRSGIGRSQLVWMFIGDGLVGLAGQSIAKALCTRAEASD